MTNMGNWLSATSAGRLLRCPASAALVSTPKPIPPSRPQNAGTLAHFAMSAWLDSGVWLDDEHGEGLQQAWDREVARWQADGKRLRDSVMTRARLRSRAPRSRRSLRALGPMRVFESSLRTTSTCSTVKLMSLSTTLTVAPLWTSRPGGTSAASMCGFNSLFTLACRNSRQGIYPLLRSRLVSSTAQCRLSSHRCRWMTPTQMSRRCERSVGWRYLRRSTASTVGVDSHASPTGVPPRHGLILTASKERSASSRPLPRG